ncbi:hypothetical protein [Acholeplasma equifetale]|uniref:hypothetical protein n=1 Tax=Acholeplasma equifetale TaxID=264634 RepID=UPI00138AE969|nr:hypothetical protein [Acholeplasma equifetale]
MLFKIADLIVQMNPIYEPLKTQSKKYLIEGDFHVDIDIPDLTQYIHKYQYENPHLSIGECEYLITGAYFYSKLIEHDGILIHASAVVYQNKAYLFSAPSGTGKSTHTNLWVKYLEAFVLNDDKPAIRIKDSDFIVYGTPFTGKEDLGVNDKYPLGNIIFIEQSKQNWIKELSKKDSIKNIYRETVRPHNEIKVDCVLNFIEKLIEKVKIYQFGANISKEAVYTALHGLGLIGSIEYILETKGYIVTNVYGKSMLPLLKENENQTLIIKTNQFNLYDVVLFKSKDKLVLHRIIKKKNDFFYITGDNQYRLEKVHQSKILGVMIAYYKNDLKIDVSDKAYQAYVKKIIRTRFIRMIKIKLKNIFKNIFKKG